MKEEQSQFLRRQIILYEDPTLTPPAFYDERSSIKLVSLPEMDKRAHVNKEMLIG